MSIDAEMVVWQSWTGKWNVAVSPDQEWAQVGLSKFSYLETGFATEDEALRVDTGCGGATILPFEPHDRATNDRYDVEAKAFGQPYKGPAVVVDQDALDRQALAEAEQEFRQAEGAVARAQERYRMSSYYHQDLSSAGIALEKARADVAKKKAVVKGQGLPQGPLYTPEMLADFQVRYADQARTARSEPERDAAKQIASFYSKLFTRANKARAAAMTAASDAQGRQPKGIPVGGQFATKQRGDTGDLS